MESRSAASSGVMLLCSLISVSLLNSLQVSSRQLFEDGLGFEKRFDSIFSVLAANTGKFEPTPGRIWIVCHVVDHDAAGSQLGRHPACALQVLSKNGGVKTVVRIISDSDGIVVGVVSDHTKNGTEDFFPGDRHVVLHIHEHRGLCEEACVQAIRMTFSTDEHLSAFLNAFANVRLDTLILFLRNHRSNYDVGIGRITNRKGAHDIAYRSLHLIETALRDEKPRSGGACLAAVHKGHDESGRDGLVECGVIEHDAG